MRLVNSAFSEIVENRNIYLPQGITHLHLGKIFFSFSLTKFVRMENTFPLIRTTQEKQRQKDN